MSARIISAFVDKVNLAGRSRASVRLLRSQLGCQLRSQQVWSDPALGGLRQTGPPRDRPPKVPQMPRGSSDWLQRFRILSCFSVLLGLGLVFGLTSIAWGQRTPESRVPSWLRDLGEVVLGSPEEQARRNSAPNIRHPQHRQNPSRNPRPQAGGQLFPGPASPSPGNHQSSQARPGIFANPGHTPPSHRHPLGLPGLQGANPLQWLLGSPRNAPRAQAGPKPGPTSTPLRNADPPDPSWLDSMFGLPTAGGSKGNPPGILRFDRGEEASDWGQPSSGVPSTADSLPGALSSGRVPAESHAGSPDRVVGTSPKEGRIGLEVEPPLEPPVEGAADSRGLATRFTPGAGSLVPSVPARDQSAPRGGAERRSYPSRVAGAGGIGPQSLGGRAENVAPGPGHGPSTREGELGIHRRLQELVASPFAPASSPQQLQEPSPAGGPEAPQGRSPGPKGEAVAGDSSTSPGGQLVPSEPKLPSPTLAGESSGDGQERRGTSSGSLSTPSPGIGSSGNSALGPTRAGMPTESRTVTVPPTQPLASEVGPSQQAVAEDRATLGKAGVAWAVEGEIGVPVGASDSPGKTGGSERVVPETGSPAQAGGGTSSEAQPPKSQAESESATPPNVSLNPEKEAPLAKGEEVAETSTPGNESPGSRVLLVRQGPVIQVETTGSDRLLKGQTATYEIRVRNAGQSEAEEFVLRVALPGWVDLVATKASKGEIRTTRQSIQGGNGSTLGRELEWHLSLLAPQQQEVLQLQLLPQRSEVLDLGLSWDHRPARSRTSITVQEPQLRLRVLSGRELLARVRQPVEVQVENAGTARAEEVHIRFSLDGAAEVSTPSVQLETVEVGERKLVLVELTAQRPGPMMLSCHATARGGFQTQITERLMIREPRLAVRWQLPTSAYVGAEVQGELLVTNQGDAPAEETVVKIHWPEAAECVHTPPELERLSSSGTFSWKVGRILPGEEKVLTFRLRPRELGTLMWSAEVASGPWNAVASTSVQVQGFASLRLSLVDPPQPVPVGTEVPYEVRIENRGTKAVDNFEVVVFFSWGIEPVAAEGAPAILAPGQVVFSRVGPLGPGQEKRLRVIAIAESPGDHACRAELGLPNWPTKLVAQQVTPYYVPNAGGAKSPPSLARGQTATSGPTVRVADRVGQGQPGSPEDRTTDSPSDRQEAAGQPLPSPATQDSAPIRR